MSNSNGAVNTKYAGSFEYDQSNYLTRIATEEGQISITSNGNEYVFEYYLKDHLGNVRMVMSEAGAKVQETEYFPFGLAIPKTAGMNKYLYNGKEKQPETNWLDYGARMYDPTIGRWGVVDPLATKNHKVSGYSYVLNNPMLYSDPLGLDTLSANAASLASVKKGDVVVYTDPNTGVKTSETQSADEATVKGQRGSSQPASMTLIFPETFGPTFRPGPTPVSIPRAAPLLIPVAYSVLDQYLKSPSAIEGIAQILERFGVDSEVLRGPAYRNADDFDVPRGFKETKEFGWIHGQKVYQKGERYISRDVGQKDGSSHNGGVWKEFRKVGNRLKRTGTLDENLNWKKD